MPEIKLLKVYSIARSEQTMQLIISGPTYHYLDKGSTKLIQVHAATSLGLHTNPMLSQGYTRSLTTAGNQHPILVRVLYRNLTMTHEPWITRGGSLGYPSHPS